MSTLRALLIPLALPAALAAAETAAAAPAPTVPAMAPTPSNPPMPIGRHNHLVDRAIPAYGMNLHRTAVIDLTAAQLVGAVRRLVADVDTKTMSGALHRPAPTYAIPTDEKGQPIKNAAPQLVQRKPLDEEQRLMALVEALTKREVILRPGGISAPIPEQQLLDAAFADLARAAEALSLGIGDELYTNLEAQHTAWLQRYHFALAKAREDKIAELMNGPDKLSRSRAEAAVSKMDFLSELPAMDDTPAAQAPAPQSAKPAPAPAEAPATVPEPEPAPAPAPAAELPAAEPAPAAPAEPVAEPALPPVEAAPEAAAPVEAAPAVPAAEAAPEAPAMEAAPAEAAPAEAAPAEAAPAEAAPAPEAPAEPAPAPAPADAGALPDL